LNTAKKLKTNNTTMLEQFQKHRRRQTRYHLHRNTWPTSDTRRVNLVTNPIPHEDELYLYKNNFIKRWCCAHKTSLAPQLLLKCLLCQARKVGGHVFLCKWYRVCLLLCFWNCDLIHTLKLFGFQITCLWAYLIWWRLFQKRD
jgi:hypothetical protein